MSLRNRRRQSWLGLLVWGVGLPLQVLAEPVGSGEGSPPTLKLAFSDFPPYSIEAGMSFPAIDSGDCQGPEHIGYGIDTDFLQAIAIDAGFQAEVNFFPYARLSKVLAASQQDASAGFFYSEVEGKPKYHYILYDLGGATHFYMRAEEASGLQNVEQLKQMSLAVVRDEYFHNDYLDAELKPGGELEPAATATDYAQLFRLLKAGRVDVIAVNNVVGSYIIESEGLTGLASSPLVLPYGRDPVRDGIYVALRKDLPDSWVDRLRESTERLRSRGVFRCIQKKYGVLTNDG